MVRELWGTFSVKDHCLPNAFVREVLLFDRLVLPVPETEEERLRWEHPNAADPTENWNPSRLDVLRGILGSQRLPAEAPPRDNGASPLLRRRQHPNARSAPDPLIWDSPWSNDRWSAHRNLVELADTITSLDAFSTTRSVLAMGEDLPGVIEAVAAFPSKAACRAELAPLPLPPVDTTAAQALLMLGTPLLVPSGEEGTDFGPLRAAAELAREPTFRAERQAYYRWMREFVEPLQQHPDQTLAEIEIDRASIVLAGERLQSLVSAQRELLGADERKRRWSRVEFASTVVSVGLTAGLALAAAMPVVGAAAPLVGFGGWLASKRANATPPEPRPLGGASMFVTAQRRLGWDD